MSRFIRWNENNDPRTKKDELGYGEIDGDENAYQSWVDRHNGEQSKYADPSMISNEDVAGGVEEDLSTEMEIMEAGIRMLTPRQQEVYKLIFKEGLTEREAADEMGVSAPTVHEIKEAAVEKLTEFCRRHYQILEGE